MSDTITIDRADAVRRWMRAEISTGKLAEALGVPLHVLMPLVCTFINAVEDSIGDTEAWRKLAADIPRMKP